MRILMVSDVYFPRINGVSTSIATFRNTLAALGHPVSLIAPAYPGARGDDEPWVRRIDSRGVWSDPEDRMMHYRSVVALARPLRGEAFDVIHIQTPFVAHYAALRLARGLCLPVIESYHTYFEEYLSCYLPFVPPALTRLVARVFSKGQNNAVDGVVVPSTAMKDKLASYGVTSELRVIPTGLDLKRFGRGDGGRFRYAHGIESGRPMLLYVGRVAHEKNIDFLLHMLVDVRKAVPSVLLVITGEGPAEAHLRRLAEQLGVADNVRFLGYLDRDTTLLDCYAAADVFVFASRTETQGLVLLEAMASGTPVVAPAVMGTRDVLRDGAGAIVARDQDRADFAGKVIYLLRDEAVRHEQGRRGRITAADWSNESCAQRLLAFYADVIERHRARSGAAVPAH